MLEKRQSTRFLPIKKFLTIISMVVLAAMKGIAKSFGQLPNVDEDPNDKIIEGKK